MSVLAVRLVAESTEGDEEDHHNDDNSAEKTHEVLWLFHSSSEVEDDPIALEVKHGDAEEVRQLQYVEHYNALVLVMVLDLNIVLVEDDEQSKEDTEIGQ